MPLDVAHLRLEDGTRREADQILAREAPPPREQQGEEDGSPAHLQQGEQEQGQEQQHAGAVQSWEEMVSHQTLLSVLTFQGCNLTDDFLERVFTPRTLACCPQLSTLNLTKKPYITEMGYAALVRALSVVKRASLCPYLLAVAVGFEAADPEFGWDDDDEDEYYGYGGRRYHTQEVCFERVKSAIHNALHPFG